MEVGWRWNSVKENGWGEIGCNTCFDMDSLNYER